MAPYYPSHQNTSPNTLSPKTDLSELTILEFIQPTQDTNTYPENTTVVSWYTLSHQKLTMKPTIVALTRQYCNACERNGHLADSGLKHGLHFLPPQTRQKMHQ